MRISSVLALALFTAFGSAGLEVELQPGPGEGKDAFVSSGNPDTNYGSHFHMYAGRSAETGSALRAFIEFTELNDYIDDGYTCTEATLELNIFAITAGEADTYGVYRVEEEWDSNTITWNTQPDFGGTPVTFGELWEGGYPIDVTEIVAEWFDGTAAHYGFCIKHEDEGSTESGNFGCYSSDESVPDTRPKLIVALTAEAVEMGSAGKIKAVFR